MNPFLKNPVITALVAFPVISQAAQLEVTATNKLPLARASQTIELSAADLAPLGAKELNPSTSRTPPARSWSARRWTPMATRSASSTR